MGDLANISDETKVQVEVHGPSWVTARKVELFANGIKIREMKIAESESRNGGLKSSASWNLKGLSKDCFLVAVAHGDGVSELFWPTAKPYQPTSTKWTPYTIGISGPVWLNVDGDDSFSSPKVYATELFKNVHKIEARLKELDRFDAMVSIHAARLLQKSGQNLLDDDFQSELSRASEKVRRAFRRYIESWKANVAARNQDD